MKSEIQFLMKVLRNAYCPLTEDDKVKNLDAFWKTFESTSKQLDQIQKKAKREEKSLSVQEEKSNDNESNIAIQENIILEESTDDTYRALYKKIRTDKEEFYTYMMDCNDCLIKKK